VGEAAAITDNSKAPRRDSLFGTPAAASFWTLSSSGAAASAACP